MVSVLIKTNAGQATAVTVRDLGIVVPPSGGVEEITNEGEKGGLRGSSDLRDYLTDDAFGAGSSTLILNDGSGDIPQDEAFEFIEQQVITDMRGATPLLDGVAGLVPKPVAGQEDFFLAGDATFKAAVDGDYAGRFEQAAIGTGDITLNKWGWWWDTINSKLYTVRNRAGTLYAIEANPL